MTLRKHNAWLGCALLMAGCQLLVSSRGDEPDASKSGGETCGTVTCAKGLECCNASCGICTETDGVCLQVACEPATVGKTCSDLSCPKGDSCMETPAGPQCVPATENPCNLVDCAPQHVCEVIAGAATCRPLGAASDAGTRDGGTVSDAGRAKDAATSDTGTPSDAGAAQDSGSTADAVTPAVDTGTPAVDAAPSIDANPAVPDTGMPPSSCAVTLCPAGTYCDDISGSAKCIKNPSCDTVKCAAGKHCELIDVVCVRAPCPPLPMCVDDPAPTDPCAKIKCGAGTHCEVFNWCIATDETDKGAGGGNADLVAPIPPVGGCKPTGRCVPDGGACGGKTCSAGTYCCNASCGTCAPKGGACLDVICPVAE
jgi:hypothetical protein